MGTTRNPAYTGSVTAGNLTLTRSQVTTFGTLKHGEHGTMNFVKRNVPKSSVEKSGLTASKFKEYTKLGTYTGDWELNERSGIGTQVYTDGSRYEGQWKNNLRHGNGTLYVPRNGHTVRQYTGEWFEDKPGGKGTFFYANGDKYEGMFFNGLCHGVGTMEYAATNSRYQGSWINGKRHGIGTYIESNGDYYHGMWEFDMRCGSGISVSKSKNRVYEGEWVNDTAKCGQIYSLDTYEGDLMSFHGSGSVGGSLGDSVGAGGSMTYKEYLNSLVENDPLTQRDCTIPVLELHKPNVVLNEAYIKAKTSVQRKKLQTSIFSYSPMYLDTKGTIRTQVVNKTGIIPNFKAPSAVGSATNATNQSPARKGHAFYPDMPSQNDSSFSSHTPATGTFVESTLTGTGGVSAEGSVIHYSDEEIQQIITHPNYQIDPDVQVSLSLTDSEVWQLATAFAVGDVRRNGTMKADIKVLVHVASRLGIQTDYANLVELLKRLVESQSRENSSTSHYVQNVDSISFKVFTTEMSFLKD